MFGYNNSINYVCIVVRVNDIFKPYKYKIMKTTILDRVNAKSVNTTKSAIVVTAKGEVKQDENAPASKRLTYALYQANRAASKVNGCQIFNDWHKQGLTVKECNELIAEYNKVTGYVYKPKTAVKKEAKSAQKEALPNLTKSINKTVKKAVKTVEPTVSEANAGKIEALKQMRAEGLLTVPELVEALNGLK